MFQKIAQFLENRFPNKYWEALSLFIAQLSIIKLIWVLILVVWNLVLLSSLFNNAVILMNGSYMTGRVENIISKQSSSNGGSIRTSYSAVIGYTMNSSHHTFQSSIIWDQPPGTRFTLVMSPNSSEIYTLVGLVLVSCGIICFMVQFIPIYLMIWDYIITEMNQKKSLWNDIWNRKSLLEKWGWIWAYWWMSWLILVFVFFVYFN